MPNTHVLPRGRQPRSPRTPGYVPPHVSDQRTFSRLKKAERQRINAIPLGGVRPGQQRLDVEAVGVSKGKR